MWRVKSYHYPNQTHQSLKIPTFSPLFLFLLFFKILNSSYSRGCGNCGKLFKTISPYTFYADLTCGKPVDKNG
jgi:hypothetical protein